MEKHSKRIIDIFFYKYICGTKSPVKWHEVSWHEIVVARSRPHSLEPTDLERFVYLSIDFLQSSGQMQDDEHAQETIRALTEVTLVNGVSLYKACYVYMYRIRS